MIVNLDAEDDRAKQHLGTSMPIGRPVCTTTTTFSLSIFFAKLKQTLQLAISYHPNLILWIVVWMYSSIRPKLVRLPPTIQNLGPRKGFVV